MRTLEGILSYNPKEWKHWYSVPFALAIYLISHYAANGKRFNKV